MPRRPAPVQVRKSQRFQADFLVRSEGGEFFGKFNDLPRGAKK
jgi:hypothetical protein